MKNYNNAQEVYDALSAPLPVTYYKPSGTTTVNKKTYMTFAAYAENHLVTKRMHEVFGVDGWEMTFEELTADNSMICNLTCNILGKQVTKSGVGSNHYNAGSDSAKNKEISAKGTQTNAFVRAAYYFGIGEHEKSLPVIKLEMAMSEGKKVYLGFDGKTILHTLEDVVSYLNNLAPWQMYFVSMVKSMCAEDRTALKPQIDAITKMYVEKYNNVAK